MKEIFVYILLGILILVFLYIGIRILSAGVFRSYFEMKQLYNNNRKKEDSNEGQI